MYFHLIFMMLLVNTLPLNLDKRGIISDSSTMISPIVGGTTGTAIGAIPAPAWALAQPLPGLLLTPLGFLKLISLFSSLLSTAGSIP